MSEIVNWSPATTEPDATAGDAATLMRQHDVGGLVVVSDGSPVGIVTERDLVRKVVAEGRAPAAVRVRDVMSTPLIVTRPTTDVSDVARAMASHRIRRMPVIAEDGRVGMVTDRDILALSPALFDLSRDSTATLRHKTTVTIEEEFEGHCEGCGTLSDALRLTGGEVLCEDCRDDHS